jgi:hypothetical protein
MAAKQDSNEKTISIQQLRYLQGMEKKKLQQLSKRLRMTQRLMGENATVKESLKELGNGSKDAIIPLGAGIFASGTIIANSFKRTLPGNVVMPASKEDIHTELSGREKVYAQDAAQLEKEIQATYQNLTSMNTLLKMNKKQSKKA